MPFWALTPSEGMGSALPWALTLGIVGHLLKMGQNLEALGFSQDMGLLKTAVVPAVWRELCHQLGRCHVKVLNTLTKSKAFSKPLTSALVFLGVLEMLNKGSWKSDYVLQNGPLPCHRAQRGWQGGDSSGKTQQKRLQSFCSAVVDKARPFPRKMLP